MIKSISLRLFSWTILPLIYILAVNVFHVSFLSSPSKIFHSLKSILYDGSFVYHSMVTLRRVFLTTLISFLATVFVGISIGFSKSIQIASEKLLVMAQVVPAFVWIIFMLIFFGIGERTIIIAIFFSITPLLIPFVISGVKNLDPKLSEVGKVFGLNWYKQIRRIILPQLVPYLVGIIRLGFVSTWKVVLLAETFGLSSGVGYQINLSYYGFLPHMIYAWLIGFGSVVLVIEKFLFQPLESRLIAWRTGGDDKRDNLVTSNQ